MRSGTCFGLLFLLTASGALAIYEEQAGENDWHSEFVGQPFQTEVLRRDHVVVATSLNVVAALRLNSGSVSWRQILQESDQLQSFTVLTKPSEVVSLSSSGTVLRAWRSDDGALLWEQQLLSGTAAASAAVYTLPEANAGSGEGIAVVAAGTIQVYSGVKGALLWEARSSSTWLGASNPLITGSREAGNEAVGIAGITSSGALDVLQLSLASGEVLSKAAHSVPRSVSLDPAVLLRDSLVAAISSDGQQLCFASSDGNQPLTCKAWSDISPAIKDRHQGAFLLLKSDNAIAVKFSSGVLVISVAKGSIQHATFLPGATAVSNQLTSSGSSTVAVAGTTNTGSIQIHIVYVDTAQISQQVTLKGISLLTKDSAPIQISKVFHPAGRAAAKPFVGLTAEDGTMLFTKGEEVVWKRDEALAEVSAALFVDLPADAKAGDCVDASHKQTGIMDQIQSQILNLKGQLNVIKPEEKAQLARLKASLSDRLMPTRDTNGFRKLLVVLSRAGKLSGLHSGDGHVMWSLTYPRHQVPQHILPWRSFHDLQRAPELLTMHSAAAFSSYSIVNAHSGRELGSGDISFPVIQVLELPQLLHDKEAEQHVYLLIGGKGGKRVQLLPDNVQSKQLLQSLSTDVFFWQEDKPAGTLTGFHINRQTLAVTQLWSSVFATPGTALLEVAARNPADQVYSQAKILGNKSLKIKYLNPSTVFVATGPPQGRLTEDINPGSTLLTVQILDTVTGAPIHRQVHKGCRGPVHAQFVENWVAYHYFDVTNHRWEMSVLELYNKAQGNVTISDMVFGKIRNSMSSYEPVPAEVLRQSFFIDTAVKAMGVSSTMHGISSKFLLLGTLSDQVYMLDKRLLDPRRPIGKPSQDDQLEQLIPYQQDLPLVPLQYATHSRQVAQLSGIATSPANLESTSLMLAYGLDLFFARIQPNQAFDSLQDDFPYAFLVLITLILTGAVLVFKRIDDKSTTQRKWL